MGSLICPPGIFYLYAPLIFDCLRPPWLNGQGRSGDYLILIIFGLVPDDVCDALLVRNKSSPVFNSTGLNYTEVNNKVTGELLLI